MSIHNKIIFTVLSISYLLFTSCATSYAPDNWLPETDDVQQEIFGGWITLVTKPDSLKPNEKWIQYSGEFISLDEENVYLLYDSIYVIPKKKIYSSTLELDQKNSTAYGLWTVGGIAGTVTNGLFLVITAPLWLVAGIPATVGESVRDRYEEDEPTQEYWDSINKFARFPQGISDIDLTTIKPVFIFQELK